jgi:hypothetical protein
MQLRKDAWKNCRKRTADDGHRYLGDNRTGIDSTAHAGEQGHRPQNLPSDAVGNCVGGNLIEVVAQRGNYIGAEDAGGQLDRAGKFQFIETETRPR